MSLISDTQKKNAGVKEPTIKPVKSTLPELQPAPLPDFVEPTAAPTPEAASVVAQPQLVQPQQELPTTPEGQPAPAPAEAEQSVLGVEPPHTEGEDFDFSLTAPVEVQKAPPKAIPATLPIWQNTTEQLGYGAALKTEVVNSSLPSFSVQTPSNAGAINQAYGSLNSSIGKFNTNANQEYIKAQQAQADLSKRGALPNTPDATKRWYSAPLGFLGDVLFGTERARKLSEEGIVDAGAASFGRQGAGLGGQINYLLNTIPNLFVAATGEANTLVANSLQGLGVSKKAAEGFARDGFLSFLPDYIGGAENLGTLRKTGLNVGALKPSSILNFNFEEANKRNLFVDAIAGDPLNDINDPDGSVKYGRIYTRSQRKEGGSATSDPLGFALQMGTYLFNPGEIPGDTLVSAGISKLWRTIKPPKAATQAAAEIITNLPALPSSAMRREAQLAQEAQAVRTATAGRRITQPASEASEFGFDLSNITEEQARKLNIGTPKLSGFIDPELPALNSTGELTTAQRGTGALSTAQESVSELNPPRLDYGEARIEYPTDARKPVAANPSVVPRAYIGDGEVTRAALPPVFDPADVPNLPESYLLPYSTPAKTALELGLGNSNIRIESPGALAIRTLSDIKAAVNDVDPKLLEDFEGSTWSDFKEHLNSKVEDIGQFSNIGEGTEAVRRVSLAKYRARLNDRLLTDILTSDRVDIYDTTLDKVGRLLNHKNVDINSYGDVNIASPKGSVVPLEITEAIEKVDTTLSDLGVKLDGATDVYFNPDKSGAAWYQEANLMEIGNADEADLFYAHEYWHRLDYAIKSKGREGHDIFEAFVNNPVVKKYYVSNYASMRRFSPEEQWAEAFAYFVTRKEELMSVHPEYAGVVEETIGKVRRLLEQSKPAKIDSAIEAPIKEFRRKQVITSERVRQVRNIKSTVSSNSFAAIQKVDDAAGAKKELSEKIQRYINLADDIVKNTIEPLQKNASEQIDIAVEDIKTLQTKGATEAQIANVVDSLESFTKQIEETINSYIEQVETLKKAAENLNGNDYYIAELRYKNALYELKQTRVKNDFLTGKLKVSDDVVGTARVKPTEDDLLTAAEELAQHKLALDKPLQQLDALFDETVDFGRKSVDNVAYDVIDPRQALKTIENEGILKFVPNIFLDKSKEGLRLKNAWVSGDYEYLTNFGKRNGFTLEQMLENVVERNNSYITQANRIYAKPTIPEAVVKLEGSLFHGTALDNWTPPDNLYVNGSRGELGGGTYYTLDKQVATDYARARVSDNVSPKTMDFDLNPTLAEVEPKFTSTLDAQLPIDKNKLKQVFKDLPEPILKKFLAALGRKKKPQTYVQLRAMMEESIVKTGAEPTEELLQQIDADISKNLRSLGFDSVVDNKSGFVLSLDNSRVSLKTLENVPTPSVVESAIARLNADAHAAKNYPDLLTTDANLRDSNYKVLAQTRDAVDKKLTQVQDEIIGRGLPEQDTILPKQPDTDTKPQSFLDTTDELLDEGICSI